MTLVLDPSQELAVDLVCSAPLGIVTGGPGVGKSTCLRTALDRLDAIQKRYRLCAPTGKAGARIKEATGRDASTIHRLLEFNPGKGGFQRHKLNPLEGNVVVVDEASMLDVELGAALLDAIETRTRLILIGDADQLPPVGPGRVFADLVESGLAPVARLTTLHRAAQQSWIHRNAPRVLRGESPELDQAPDFRFIEVDDAAQLKDEVCRLVTKIIPAEIDRDAQVLIPQRKGVAGIETVNVALQNAMNPRQPSDPHITREKFELRMGDRVIQTKNDYLREVFNGEIGNIIDLNKNGVTVLYPDRVPVVYSLEQAGALQLAYALTCHKSQGSEWPWVIVVCHSTHHYSLSRQLFYTAITRAREGVILVGDKKGLAAALSGKEPVKRNTTLIERMRGEVLSE